MTYKYKNKLNIKSNYSIDKCVALLTALYISQVSEKDFEIFLPCLLKKNLAKADNIFELRLFTAPLQF